MNAVAGLVGDGGQTTKRYDIPVAHLDYGYIEKCTDVKELEKIFKILRSGEEGVYPEMERQCADKIASLNPHSRVLRQDQPILTTRELGKEESTKLTEDFDSWASEMKNVEQSLKSTDTTKTNDTPPVRAAGSTATSKTSKNTKSSKRVKPRDYREWDKVDVEAELEKVDKEPSKSTNVTKMSGGEPAQVAQDDVKDMTEEERSRRAEREKDKGNEEFKSGDYKQALAYYSRSLAFLPALNSFNNRALAYVKLKEWDKAINDCNTVLKMDDNNIKALLRRSLSYKGKFMYMESETDLNRVLVLEPQNKRAQDMLEEVVKERMKTQSSDQATKAAPSGKGRRMVIQETDESSSDEEIEEVELPKKSPSTAPPKSNHQGATKTEQKPAETPSQSAPVDKSIDLSSKLLLNGDSAHDEDNAINPNITLDVNKSKNPTGKLLIEEISSDSNPNSSDNAVESASEEKIEVEPPRERLELIQKPLPAKVERLKAAGAELFIAGQYGDAMEKYMDAVNILPEDHIVNLSLLYSNIAACKTKIGDCKGCISASTQSLDLVPHSIKPLLRRADAYEHLERYDKAYADYRHILNMDSYLENAQRGSTRCAAELRKVNGMQWRDKLPAIPNPALADIPLVTMLGAGKPASTTAQPNTKAVSAQPVSEKVTQPTRSKEELFEEYKTQGNDFVKKSKFKEAVSKYEECIKLCPDNVVPYTNRALCYLRLNKPSLAADDCSEALQRDPSNVKALFRRGQAYKMQGKYQESFSDLRSLLKLEPKNGPAKKEMQLVLKYISEENEKAKASKKRVKIKEVNSSDDDD